MQEVITLADGLHFPEGPAFDRSGLLWAVELKGAALVSWREGVLQRHSVGGRPNGIAIDALDRIVFADAEQNAIRRFDPGTKQCETLAESIDGEPLTAPNDLAYDGTGNLVFTCPGGSRQEPTGYVCVLTPKGEVQKIASDLYFPNGLAFSADGSHLFIAETYRQRVWQGSWDQARCEWSTPTVWCDQLHGAPGPDGMAFDVSGHLWVAVYGSGALCRVTSEGVIHSRIPMPGQNPTNCAFDPSGRLGLVVTEAEKGLLLSLPTAGPGIPLFS